MTREQYANAYDQGFPITRKFLVSRGINLQTAEEAAQAAWAKGWERRDTLRNPAMVLSWVNTIALNEFRNWFRRQRTGQVLAETPVQPHANPRLTGYTAGCYIRQRHGPRPRSFRQRPAQLVVEFPARRDREQ
jgi:DNA-directed RNA polymerase specialized sigma24 family protein